VVTAATGAAICRTFQQKFNTTTGTDEGDGEQEQEQQQKPALEAIIILSQCTGIIFQNLQFQSTSPCQRQRQRQPYWY